MRTFLLFFFLVLAGKKLKADIFTVTSNSNAGIGTLREAITLANANGTGLTDYIYFNLPGSSKDDVTIALETELPVLTSNIVIDGTTQLFSALGNPNIKVSLIRVAANYFNGFRLDNASNVEIYGFVFSNFKSDPLGAVEDKKGGIFLYNSSNVIIGAPDKPNCFAGNYAGILSPFVIPRFNVENIKISSNIFGLVENGITAAPNETGIDISFMKNSVIGGDTPEEGNLITANITRGIALGGADGNIKISNNIIGLDRTLSRMIPSVKAEGIYVNGGTSIPDIKDNVICGQSKAILVDYVNGGFRIRGNKIGTGITGNESFGNSVAIHINFSKNGMIGGGSLSDQNKIAYNQDAVLIEISYPISILKNSIYCNSRAVLFKNLPDGKDVTGSKITTITSNSVSGRYLPNSVIELFYLDNCPGCQGKTWLATIPTDADGNWSFSGNITGPITSMGTNADGATSNFSKTILDDSQIRIQSVFCGERNGSIKGVQVFDASIYRWYDENGNLVGTSKDLENVGTGIYQLKTGQQSLCDVVSAKYTISAFGGGIDESKKIIINASCNVQNGSITNITVANNMPRKWYDVTDTEVAATDDLINAGAGKYYFKAGFGNCEITSPVYEIKNINIVYKVKSSVIHVASCGKWNGSIKIGAFEGGLPTSFVWTDANGDVIGNTKDLIDVAPGFYTLIASDSKGCSNIAGVFEVKNQEPPVVDFSEMKKYLNCEGTRVSTTGIKIRNDAATNYSYKWLASDLTIISNSLNLDNVTPGFYKLLIEDQYGCTVESSFMDFSNSGVLHLKVPNSISPNGDGINDLWNIQNAFNYPKAEYSIFNRNGQKVFFSIGYLQPFDGTFKGKPLPVGVYYYLIDLKANCGTLSGSLTLFR